MVEPDEIKRLKPESEGRDGSLKIALKLCGEKCQITFSKGYLQEIIKTHKKGTVGQIG
ncbi:MAG: hypothetical protein R2941_15285 [Desulfobacterales bacterium]